MLTSPLLSNCTKYSSRASFTNSLPYKCAVRFSGSWRWSHAARSILLLGLVTYARVTILSSSGVIVVVVVECCAARRAGRLRRIDDDIIDLVPGTFAALSLVKVLYLFMYVKC